MTKAISEIIGALRLEAQKEVDSEYRQGFLSALDTVDDVIDACYEAIADEFIDSITGVCASSGGKVTIEVVLNEEIIEYEISTESREVTLEDEK